MIRVIPNLTHLQQMSDYPNMGARQLRKLASAKGITGASRMTKAEILFELATLEDTSLRQAGTMTRGERDELRPRAYVLYHPAQGLDDHDLKSKASLSRYHRRHTVHNAKTLGGLRTWVTNVKRADRKAGVMVPVTRRQLFNASARLP